MLSSRRLCVGGGAWGKGGPGAWPIVPSLLSLLPARHAVTRSRCQPLSPALRP